MMNYWSSVEVRSVVLLALAIVFAASGCSSESGGKRLGQVHGTIVTPLDGARVYIYQKGADLYGPAFAMSEASGHDGAFAIDLPVGDYVAVVRRRGNGETSGPVVAGDHKSEIINLSVTKGGAELTIVAAPKVGDVRQLTKDAAVTDTGFAGLISDSDGKPVEGARVHVYDHVQMSERPKFVSEKTGPDGRFQILLPAGGTYYLAARDKFGGPPKLGDLYGRYDQGTIEPSAVVVKSGEVLKEVNITVTKVW